MPDIDTSLPSTRSFQTYVKQNTTLELKTTTGDNFTGRMLWQDPDYFCLIDADEQQYFLKRELVVYIKPLDGAS